MKVLHVVPSLDASQGGVRTAVAGAIAAMRQADMQVDCACVGEPDPPLEGISPLVFAGSAPQLFKASTAMRQWLQGNAASYDTMVVHTLWLSPTRYAVDAARAAGRNVFLVPHGMLDPDALAHHAWRKRLRWLSGEGRRVRACNLVFSTLADAERARSTTQARGLPFVVIPNAVDPRWRPAQRPANPVPVIVCLNRLHPRKGVLELVQALAHLHRQGLAFRADFAGLDDDPEYATLVRREARPLEQAGVLRWLGGLGASQTVALVQAADVLVHPATGFENFGMAIAEAASAGICVLASPRALLAPEMAAAGALAMCEPRPDTLADSLARLLQDSVKRATLGTAALAYSRRFTPAEIGQAWHRVFDASAVTVAKL